MSRSDIPFEVSPLRYSAKSLAKPINFFCSAPEAKAVFIMGDFNDWDPASHPMKHQPDGTWIAAITLARGHHHYRFVVDGKAILDPRAQGIARDHEGNKVSLVSVS